MSGLIKWKQNDSKAVAGINEFQGSSHNYDPVKCDPAFPGLKILKKFY